MTPEQIQKLKELRNALSCWQEDYDPTEDKEQFDMFGDAIDAVGRLEAAEALAEFRGKHVSSLDKLIADRDKRIAELTAVVDQRNAECDRLIIEKGLLRIKAAPGNPVAHFILVDGEYNQLASQFAESPDAIPLYATPPAPSAPDGWKLVPVELTDDIGEAIALEARCCGGIALDIYGAALRAAPEPPSC